MLRVINTFFFFRNCLKYSGIIFHHWLFAFPDIPFRTDSLQILFSLGNSANL